MLGTLLMAAIVSVPPQAPPPPQAPAPRVIVVVVTPTPTRCGCGPACACEGVQGGVCNCVKVTRPIKQVKGCDCSSACECGCNEGAACACGSPRVVSNTIYPAVLPHYGSERGGSLAPVAPTVWVSKPTSGGVRTLGVARPVQPVLRAAPAPVRQQSQVQPRLLMQPVMSRPIFRAAPACST